MIEMIELFKLFMNHVHTIFTMKKMAFIRRHVMALSVLAVIGSDTAQSQTCTTTGKISVESRAFPTLPPVRIPHHPRARPPKNTS